MQADAVGQQPPHRRAEGGVESEVADLTSDGLPCFPIGDACAGERLCLLGRLALGEVHDVDGCVRAVEQPLDGRVQRGLGVLVVQRHRAQGTVYVVHLTPGAGRDVLLDLRCVPEGRGQQQELGVAEHDQGNLPGEPPRAVVVVVELVHHDAGCVGGLSLGHGHVGQHLGRAAHDRRRPVDAGVARQHAHVLRSEGLAQVEELLAHEGLDGRGVERALALAERLEVEAECDERLAGAGRRGEHHVPPGHQLEQRFLLGRVGLESRVAHPREEAVEDRVWRQSRADRHAIDQRRRRLGVGRRHFALPWLRRVSAAAAASRGRPAGRGRRPRPRPGGRAGRGRSGRPPRCSGPVASAAPRTQVRRPRPGSRPPAP